MYVRQQQCHEITPMSSSSEQTERTVEERNSEACSVVEAVELVGSQWRLVVLYDLSEGGERRFNELKRSTGASSRTLSRVLSDLEEAGLVDRRVEERPIASYYSLTEGGEALCPVFSALDDWADDWL
jgi:DNA-binding HxlR family transcriptional regulator